ncbi:unnamed protein product [Cyprideis torosa]|uniref:Uncharacterized protein n=1 Tax=Cyprideis torosa TaxID=163714 RepID=A0A7R8W8A6_9CRUS|nr:unnamed protein product [Cyprideis torosa]CAG0883274.1 unnamed protein product [Cyprideis torosa]
MSSVRGGPGEDPSAQGARDHPRSPTADSHGTVDRRRRNGGLAAAVLRLESDGGRIGSIPLSFAALLNSSSPGRSNASDNRVSDIRAEEVPGETMESPFDGGGGTLRLDDFEDPALDVQTVVVAFGRFMLMIASQTLIFNLLLLRLLAMRLFHPNRRVRSPRTREVVCRLCFTTTLYHTGTLSSSWQAAEASSQSGRPRVNVAVVENAETEPVPRTNAAYDAGHENVVLPDLRAQMLFFDRRSRGTKTEVLQSSTVFFMLQFQRLSALLMVLEKSLIRQPLEFDAVLSLWRSEPFSLTPVIPSALCIIASVPPCWVGREIITPISAAAVSFREECLLEKIPKRHHLDWDRFRGCQLQQNSAFFTPVPRQSQSTGLALPSASPGRLTRAFCRFVEIAEEAFAMMHMAKFASSELRSRRKRQNWSGSFDPDVFDV